MDLIAGGENPFLNASWPCYLDVAEASVSVRSLIASLGFNVDTFVRSMTGSRLLPSMKMSDDILLDTEKVSIIFGSKRSSDPGMAVGFDSRELGPLVINLFAETSPHVRRSPYKDIFRSIVEKQIDRLFASGLRP